MFKYIKYITVVNAFTTKKFNEKDMSCILHRFDVPFVSVEYADEADFTALMEYQDAEIQATEITKEAFADAVAESVQLQRMYDVANEQYRKDLLVISKKYIQEEVSTWPSQIDEAKEVKAGTATTTPYMDVLSTEVGCTVDQAADIILGKKAAYDALSAQALTNKWAVLNELKAKVGL